MVRIVSHIARPEWGRSVVDSAYNGYSTVLFESGQKSSFKAEQLDLLNQIEGTPEDAAAIRQAHILATTPVKASKAKSARRAAAEAAMTFDEQLRQFTKMFPKGFQDNRFVTEERGRTGERGDKGYKQRMIDDATSRFSRAALEPLIDAGKFEEVFNLMVTTLKGINIIDWRETEGFKAIPAAQHEPLARSLFALLHDDAQPIAARFDAFRDAMALEAPNWPLMTLIPAFSQPEAHYFVRPTIADKQASIADVETTREPIPSGHVYTRFLRIATDLKARLEKHGLEPRDLVDVYSFSWRTLDKKSQKAPLAEEPDATPKTD